MKDLYTHRLCRPYIAGLIHINTFIVYVSQLLFYIHIHYGGLIKELLYTHSWQRFYIYMNYVNLTMEVSVYINICMKSLNAPHYVGLTMEV